MKVTPLFLLFVVFLVLKLTSVIAWSWWWVTAPLWIPLAIALTLWATFAVIAVTIATIVTIAEKR